MQRNPDSHKGENGTVAIIGGSALQHGAPLFAALAAEASGVDLLHVCVPRCHAEIAKATSLNFQVHPFGGDELSPADVPHLLELLATMDCAVIGPGIARDPATLDALRSLVSEAPCPLVLDASALQGWTMEAVVGKDAALTPHRGELERMGMDNEEIGQHAKDAHCTILAKGHSDRIAGPDGAVREVVGGNPGLTVGGTGDALAGLMCGLRAQGLAFPEAAAAASRIIKAAGDSLEPERGFSYTARDVIGRIAPLLAKL